MTVKEIGISILVLIVLVLAGVGFVSWRDSHDALIKAQAQIAAQQIVLDHYAADRTQVAANAAAQVNTVQKAAAEQKTSDQIVKWIPQQLPAPQPINITLPTPTADNPKPNAIASIPQADLPYLRDTITECQTCKINLQAANKELIDADGTIKTLTGERDLALNAAKGGTKFQRFKSALKWLSIGGGAAAVALAASGHLH